MLLTYTNAGVGIAIPSNGSTLMEGQEKGLARTHEMYAPFNVAFDTRTRYFEWLERGENVFRLRRFGKAMTGSESQGTSGYA